MTDIGIIGGGASGVLAALQFLRSEPRLTVHLFNQGYELGRGVAYSCSDRHLLNVPAGKMSAIADSPRHFYEWLEERCPGRYSADSFVSRRFYGTYLQETLQKSVKESEGRIHLHSNRVEQLTQREGRYYLADAKGDEVCVNKVVLALGNLPPGNPNLAEDAFVSDPRYLSNLWHDAERLRQIPREDCVVIFGSGLTAVDAILQLREQGHQGRIEVISRRGQWPSVHDLQYKAASPPELSGLDPRQALRCLREKIKELDPNNGNWRQVIDGLRPQTNAIWASWNLQERRQFMRHLRVYWDVHRHRVAPEVWQEIEHDLRAKKLRLIAGRATAVTPAENGLRVAYRLRRQEAVHELRAGAVINCTGSETLRRTCCQPLIRNLLDQNLAQLDPLGLGLVADSVGALLNPEGRSATELFALGPIRRGTLWETTAIPEIREQGARLVQTILN